MFKASLGCIKLRKTLKNYPINLVVSITICTDSANT